MKKFLYKAKGAVALTLAMTMFCPQVFAAELQNRETIVEVTAEELQENAIPVMTLEEALARAIKKSPALKDLEDSLELLEEQEDSLRDSVGSVRIPNYEYKRWASDFMYYIVSASYQVEQGMKQIKMGKELQKLILEMTVKTYFQTIISLEDTVELLEDAAELQKKTYDQGYTKFRLGMLSKYNLEQLQVNKQKAENTLAMTESGLEQLYITFNSLIGANPDERFDFYYDVTFETYELPLPMEMYINSKMKEDIMIQMQELTVDAAKFKNNYRSASDTGQTADSDKLSWDQEKRALKTAKEEKETLIRNTYLQIKSLETEYASAQADLNKALADYRVAQLSYQTGAVTKLAVEGAAMGVTQAENAVKSLVYEHDMLVYQFENPSILSNNNAQQK